MVAKAGSPTNASGGAPAGANTGANTGEQTPKEGTGDLPATPDGGSGQATGNVPAVDDPPTDDPEIEAPTGPAPPPLLAPLGAGASLELIGAKGALESWKTLGAAPELDSPNAAGWQPEDQEGGTRIEVRQPKNFKELPMGSVTSSEFVKSLRAYGDNKLPFYVRVPGSVSHPVPAGRWMLEGDLALVKRGLGAYVLGGLVFQRADGSYLEVDLGDYDSGAARVSGEPIEDLPKTSRTFVRAVWFDAQGVQLNGTDAGVNEAKDKEDLPRVLAMLRASGGEVRGERDGAAMTFRLGVGPGGQCELILGEDRHVLLKPPADLETNPIRQVTAFARVGDVYLRRWRFQGSE